MAKRLIESKEDYRKYLQNKGFVKESIDNYCSSLNWLAEHSEFKINKVNFVNESIFQQIIEKSTGFKNDKKRTTNASNSDLTAYKSYREYSLQLITDTITEIPPIKLGINPKVEIDDIDNLKIFWSDELNLSPNAVKSYVNYLKKAASLVNEVEVNGATFYPIDPIIERLERANASISQKEFQNWRAAVRAYAKFLDSVSESTDNAVAETIISDVSGPSYPLKNGVVIDAYLPLFELIKESQVDPIEFFFKNIYFIHPKKASDYWIKLLKTIEAEKIVRIRYNKRTFPNSVKSEAAKINNAVDYEIQTGSKSTSIKIVADEDGNREVRKMFNTLTGIVSSQGASSKVKHYTLTHIWGRTNDPLFFQSPWNVSLTPGYIALFTDGAPTDTSNFRYRFQNIFKAVAYSIYEQIIKQYPYLNIEKPADEYLIQARNLINKNIVNII